MNLAMRTESAQAGLKPHSMEKAFNHQPVSHSNPKVTQCPLDVRGRPLSMAAIVTDLWMRVVFSQRGRSGEKQGVGPGRHLLIGEIRNHPLGMRALGMLRVHHRPYFRLRDAVLSAKTHK